jgi:Rrf2 family protein
MKISTQSYYGLRALVRLAKEKRVCSAKEIASQERLPRQYLEKIFQKLKKAGFLLSTKGAAGGYSLTRKPGKIKIGQLISALEGKIVSTPCLVVSQSLTCPIEKRCLSKNLWQKMEKAVERAINSISLTELIK